MLEVFKHFGMEKINSMLTFAGLVALDQVSKLALTDKKYGIINNNPKLNTNDFFYTTGMDITKLKSLDICLLKRIGPFVINSYISPNKEYEERDCFPLLP